MMPNQVAVIDALNEDKREPTTTEIMQMIFPYIE